MSKTSETSETSFNAETIKSIGVDNAKNNQVLNNSKSKELSDLALTPKKLILYLKAMSFRRDGYLCEAGYKPLRLREIFSQLYSRRCNILTDSPYQIGDNFDSMVLENPNESDDYMLIHLNEYARDNCGYGCNSCDGYIEFYMMIWKEKNKFVYTKPHLFSYTSNGIHNNMEDILPLWEIYEEDRPAFINFVELTQMYQQLTLQICERWGYGAVIEHIKLYEDTQT